MPTEHLIAYLVAAVIAGFVTQRVWAQRTMAGGVALFVLMCALTIWAVYSAVWVILPTLELKQLTGRIFFASIITVPPTLLVLVLQISGNERWVTKRNLAFLAVVPFATLVTVWTDPMHHLFWSGISWDTSSIVPVAVISHGPLYWVWTLFAYMVLSSAIVILIRSSLGAPDLFRNQTWVVLLAIGAPLSGNLLYLFQLTRWTGFDTTCIGFVVSGLAISWGRARLQIFDMVPVARSSVFESLGDAVFVLGDRDHIVDCNKAARIFVDLAETDIVGRTADNVFAAVPQLKEYLRTNKAVSAEIELGNDVDARLYDLRIEVIEGWRGRQIGRTLVLRDINAERLAARHYQEELQHQVAARTLELSKSRSFLQRLLDNSRVYIITQDRGYGLLSTNRMFDGLRSPELDNFRDLFINDHEMAYFLEKATLLFEHGVDSFEHEFSLTDRHLKSLAIAWNHTLIENEQGDDIVLSIGMDRTIQRKAEEDLHWLANHDGLTNIGNRRHFDTALNEMLQRQIHGALVFIDINRFKQINDVYGHAVGDKVLIKIANTLKAQTRGTDVISRLAGDEFTVILARTEQDSLPGILDKLSAQLSSRIELDDDRAVEYTVSIGVALFPEHSRDHQTLTVQADLAMYHAKKKGIGHWYIYEPVDGTLVKMKSENVMQMTIANALSNNSFELAYQPILDLQTNQTSHFEVLLRLQDESGHEISPAAFIPLAERIGYIRRIDEWVLEHALRSLHQISEINDEIGLSINISAPSLQTGDFPDVIRNAISSHNVDPQRVVIELTETSYIENFQQVLINLREISEIGVRIALDDFGVGFSSFTYLKMLPLSYVKLDGSYVQHLIMNRDDQVFVKSLSAMINVFGMKTVAEFVQDQATLDMLMQLGVTHAQGYFIGKPVSFENIQESVRVSNRVVV